MKYGKLSKHEQIELNDLTNRLLGVESLFQRLIREQGDLEEKREEWFSKMRKKYSIPDTEGIAIENNEIISDNRTIKPTDKIS